MVRRLTIWIASLTVALLMMAIVLASAAHAQDGRAQPPFRASPGTPEVIGHRAAPGWALK